MYYLACIYQASHHVTGSWRFKLLQNMANGHIKVKKGTGQVFYMTTPSHATESVRGGYPISSSLKKGVYPSKLTHMPFLWECPLA